MKNILVSLFKEYNKKVEGNYFVDPVAGEVKFSEADGVCGKICSLAQISKITYEDGLIKLDANEGWELSKTGPTF